jgi:transcriptional regulator with XRE-family HTH domain
VNKTRNQAILDQFGQRIRSLRQAKGWPMEELAHRAGITYKQLSLIERGVNNVTISTIYCLAQGLEINVSLLFEPDSTSQPDIT